MVFTAVLLAYNTTSSLKATQQKWMFLPKKEGGEEKGQFGCRTRCPLQRHQMTALAKAKLQVCCLRESPWPTLQRTRLGEPSNRPRSSFGVHGIIFPTAQREQENTTYNHNNNCLSLFCSSFSFLESKLALGASSLPWGTPPSPCYFYYYYHNFYWFHSMVLSFCSMKTIS